MLRFVAVLSGSHLCISRNETVQPPYFQNRITIFCLPIPTLIYLWEIYCIYFQEWFAYSAAGKYVDRRSWENINRSQTHERGNWDWGGRAIPTKGIHKRDFRWSQKLRLYWLGVCSIFNTASSAAIKIPQCWRTLGLNAGLLRLWHWQSGALNHSARSQPPDINKVAKCHFFI